MALHPCAICGQAVHVQIMRFRAFGKGFVAVWLHHKAKSPCTGADELVERHPVEIDPTIVARAMLAQWNRDNPKEGLQ